MKRILVENACTATIENISWERIFLTFEVHVHYPDNPTPEIPLVFYGVNGEGMARVRFRQTQVDEEHFRLVVNITNQGQNRCVPHGTYSIIVCQGERKLADCETDVGLVPRMQDCSRNFLYSGRSKVFTITFFVAEGGDTLPFRMYVMPSAKTGVGAPTAKLFQHARWTLRKSLNKNRRPFLRAVYHHYRKRYRNNKNKILFMSEQSEVLGGNQLAVIRRMKERGLEGEYEILTSARRQASEHQSMRSWIETIRKMAMSDRIVVDDHAPILDWLTLDPETTLIQLWHAGAGFKSSGYSRWGHDGCPAPHSAHRQYKYGIAGSKRIAPFFSEVWGICDEQVLPTGMPRMDEYLDPVYREAKLQELYEMYPLCRGKKVILFTPTYRGGGRKSAHYPYELIDFDRLYEVCGEEYVVLFKMHPWVPTDVPIPENYRDRFVDVNKYPNINDLFYFTDLLITDYSSNIFEYSLMRKPMLFFAFDKVQYSFSRGFHRPYEESAPGRVCYTFDELLRAIEEKDFEEEKVEQYVEHHFDHIDTHASDRVIDWLIRGEIPGEIREELAAVEAANAAMEAMTFEIIDTEAETEEEEEEHSES